MIGFKDDEETPFTCEWEDEETCQIAKDGDYLSCEEAVELLNKYYNELKKLHRIIKLNTPKEFSSRVVSQSERRLER